MRYALLITLLLAACGGEETQWPEPADAGLVCVTNPDPDYWFKCEKLPVPDAGVVDAGG